MEKLKTAFIRRESVQRVGVTAIEKLSVRAFEDECPGVGGDRSYIKSQCSATTLIDHHPGAAGQGAAGEVGQGPGGLTERAPVLRDKEAVVGEGATPVKEEGLTRDVGLDDAVCA